MSRNRSRESESQDINHRRLGARAVKSSNVDLRAIRREHHWPGSVDRDVLAPGAVDETHLSPTVVEKFADGRWIEVEVPAQTWDGALVLGDVVAEYGWSSAGAFPAGAYYDIHLDLPVATGADLSWSLDVEGTTVRSGDMWAVNRVQGVIPSGVVAENEGWELVGDGLELASGGRLIMQLVDRQKAVAPPPVPAPIEGAAWRVASNTGTTSDSFTHDVTVSPDATAGQLCVIVVGFYNVSSSSTVTSVSVPAGWSVLNDELTGESFGTLTVAGPLSADHVTDEVVPVGFVCTESLNSRWVMGSSAVFDSGTAHHVDSVQERDPTFPWSAEVDASGDGFLVAVTAGYSHNDTPFESVAVDDWATGTVTHDARWTVRAQHAQSAQSARTATVVEGDADGRGVLSAIYRVAP